MEILHDLSCATAAMYADIVADPPDPDFAVVPTPAFATIGPSESPVLDELMSALDRQSAFGEVSLSAYEKYLGATEAGDEEAAAAQLRAAGRFALSQVTQMRRSADALTAYADLFRSTPDATGPLVTAEEWTDHQGRLRPGPAGRLRAGGDGRTHRGRAHARPDRGDPLALRGAAGRVRPGGLAGRPARRPRRDDGRGRARLRRVRPRGHRRGSADRGAGAAAQHATRRHPDDPHGRARHVPADHPVRDRRRRRPAHLPGRRPADTGHAAGQRSAADVRPEPGSRRAGRLHLPRQRRPGELGPGHGLDHDHPADSGQPAHRSPSRRRSTSRRARRTAARSTATTPTASP